MLTKPMKHQSIALERMAGRDYYGLFMEQGTGKTWCLMADAERLYEEGKIQAVLVIAPNGVHTNWVRREIPQHMSVPLIARAWRSGAGKRLTQSIEEVIEPRKQSALRIFAINIDAVVTNRGMDMAMKFISKFKTMLIVDESSRIKNPKAGRTESAMELRKFAKVARIATGTPVTNAPVDVFSQMEFLQGGLLGTRNYRAFVAEYAEIMRADHPMMQAMIQRNPRVARAQVVMRDENGMPRWRNLEKLQRLLEPNSFRVRKDECLDLPPKVYKTHFFELSPSQMTAYTLMKKERRMELGEDLVPVQALSAGIKLQQITSGFLLHEGEPHYVAEGNTRLKALLELLEDVHGQFIVWARFTEEIRAIHEAFKKEKISSATYFGDTKPAEREAAIDEFQSGKLRALICQQQAAGVGLTLTAAQTAIYYSNDFNLEHRLQSEDRCHRKGTKGTVVYIDLVAENTIDETISTALQSKSNMAAAIMGDLKK